jgi:hypothetical protein
MELRANPFLDRGQWYWRNEDQRINGPYRTQHEALLSLLRWLDKRTRWQKLWEAILEFIHA